MGCAVPGGRVPPPGRKSEPRRPLPRKTSPERPPGAAEPGWFSLCSPPRHRGYFSAWAGPRLGTGTAPAPGLGLVLWELSGAAAGVMLPKSDFRCGARGDEPQGPWDGQGWGVRAHLPMLPSLPTALWAPWNGEGCPKPHGVGFQGPAVVVSKAGIDSGCAEAAAAHGDAHMEQPRPVTHYPPIYIYNFFFLFYIYIFSICS